MEFFRLTIIHSLRIELNYIDYNTPIDQIQQLLEAKGWLKDEGVLHVEKAGEGNMNMVMKVETNRRTVILKQPRPYVFKYPDIEAPVDRIFTEFQFYQAIKSSSLKGQVPAILEFDEEDHLMMMEYISEARDMTYLYRQRKIQSDSFVSLVDNLNTLHSASPVSYPANLELRKLNHQHIFHLPFLEENGFSLDAIQPGLEALAAPFKTDQQIKQVVEQLGRRYLEKGDVLLHGDYYPGSWMQSEEQTYLIDAEFSHIGFREFDLGVMAAHSVMIIGDTSYLQQLFHTYEHGFAEQTVLQVAGTEIIRRLIGLAQLPMERTLEEKAQLLEAANELLIS